MVQYIITYHACLAKLHGTHEEDLARLSADFLYGSGLRHDSANSAHLPQYYNINLSVDRKFDLPTLGKVDVRVAAINVTDRVYELRDGSGIGVDAPPFGTRRGFYVGLQKDFSSNCLARGRQRSRVTPSQVSSRTHAWLTPTASRSRGFRRPFRTTLALLYRNMTIGHGRQHDVNVYILAGPHRKP